MATYTPSQVLTALQPYMTTSNRINTTALINSTTAAANVWMYSIPGTNAIVFQSSGAIDCDGNQTTNCCCSPTSSCRTADSTQICCNQTSCPSSSACSVCTDPEMQITTSFQNSSNQELTADKTPWYVLPLDPLDNGAKNPYFAYRDHGIDGGQVGLVINPAQTKMQFGIFGDENGDAQSVGEMSYAMAVALGIDPDPAMGGEDSGVTYIVFTGAANRANPIDSTSSAQSIGQTQLNALMSAISGGGDGGGGTGYNCTAAGCVRPSSGTGQYTTIAQCQADPACATVTDGTATKCSPACAKDETCLQIIGLGCQKTQYITIGAAALLLVLLLKK